jgi:glycosyltransferase involved in cell wall biosynthesis
VTLDLYRQLLQNSADWETQRQYDRWVPFERAAWGQVDRVVAMSDKDRRMIEGAPAVCLPNGVDLDRFQPSSDPPEERRLLFIGSFAHLPNVLALEFFLTEVWPLLARLDPTLHVIAGSRHRYFLDVYQERAQVKLDQPGIEVEDFVAEVRPAYRRASIVIAPLVASAGTNIKIMEAMAMGKAIVSTPAGINGLDLTDGGDVVVARTGPDMAAAIERLIEQPDERRRIEQRARRTAELRYDWNRIAERQRELYERLRSS